MNNMSPWVLFHTSSPSSRRPRYFPTGSVPTIDRRRGGRPSHSCSIAKKFHQAKAQAEYEDAGQCSPQFVSFLAPIGYWRLSFMVRLIISVADSFFFPFRESGQTEICVRLSILSRSAGGEHRHIIRIASHSGSPRFQKGKVSMQFCRYTSPWLTNWS